MGDGAGGLAVVAMAALLCACSGSDGSAVRSHGDAAPNGGQAGNAQGASGATATGGTTRADGGTAGKAGSPATGGMPASGGTRDAGGDGGRGAGGAAGAAGASSGGAAGVAGASSGGAAGAAGMCNSLPLDGPRVVTVAGAGSPPTPMGGSIADGRWVMSAYEYYGGTMPYANAMRATYDIRGGVVQYVFQEETQPLSAITFTLSISGTEVTKTRTCPAPATQKNGFTATPSEIVFISSGPTQTTVWHLTPR